MVLLIKRVRLTGASEKRFTSLLSIQRLSTFVNQLSSNTTEMTIAA